MDVTIKSIPDGISEEQVKEWISVLIERHFNSQIQKIPELVSATEQAKTDIDAYRVANTLKTKFVEEKEPVVEK